MSSTKDAFTPSLTHDRIKLVEDLPRLFTSKGSHHPRILDVFSSRTHEQHQGLPSHISPTQPIDLLQAIDGGDDWMSPSDRGHRSTVRSWLGRKPGRVSLSDDGKVLLEMRETEGNHHERRIRFFC